MFLFYKYIFSVSYVEFNDEIAMFLCNLAAKLTVDLINYPVIFHMFF